MNFLINQYSFVIFSIFFIFVVGYFLLRNRPGTKNYLAFGLVVLGILLTWAVLRPRQMNAEKVKETIGAGKPVLLEFQSPY